MRHGPNLMTFLYNPNNPMSFAASVRQYVLLAGVQDPAAPLFTTNGTTRWSNGLLDSTLSAVMDVTLSTDERRGKTFHSKRVWLACALKDRGSPEPEIQALERWASPDALRLYARMNHLYQAQKRDGVLFANVNTVNASRRPRVDYSFAELKELERLANEL